MKTNVNCSPPKSDSAHTRNSIPPQSGIRLVDESIILGLKSVSAIPLAVNLKFFFFKVPTCITDINTKFTSVNLLEGSTIKDLHDVRLLITTPKACSVKKTN